MFCNRLDILLIFLAITVSACSSAAPRVQKTVAPTPTLPVNVNAYYTPEVPAEGSLWTDNGNLFFVDKRARRVGDTVTVDIIENTSSQIDANTKASKSSTLDAEVPNLAGYMRALEAKNPTLNRDQSNGLQAKLLSATLANQFDGKGSSDRSGSITASIGARVLETLPNGNLVISGRREMRVSNEIQFITVSGIARPADITADNRIKSTYLADARIEYSGAGDLANQQRPGWFTRLVNEYWPF